MNEDAFPIENEDFGASHIIFQGVYMFRVKQPGVNPKESLTEELLQSS